MKHVSTKKLLFVDDEAEVVESAKRRLERAGYDVATAANGQEALDIVRKTKDFDLIITDVIMPIMDGFTFYKELKEDKETGTIPVVILTARTTMEDSFRALGVSDFLAKPFDAQRLVNTVEHSIKRSQSSLNRGKVLILGSDVKTLTEIVQFMRDDFCDADFSDNSIDFISQVLKASADILLIDLLMEDVPAEETIKSIRSFSRFKDLPIVTYTQFDPEDVDTDERLEKLKSSNNDCMIAGASKYIGKITSVTLSENLREYWLGI